MYVKMDKNKAREAGYISGGFNLLTTHGEKRSFYRTHDKHKSSFFSFRVLLAFNSHKPFESLQHEERPVESRSGTARFQR